MEPGAQNIAVNFGGVTSADNPSEIALVSIAISMKRIADAVEGDEKRLGLVPAIATAISDGILYAKRAG